MTEDGALLQDNAQTCHYSKSLASFSLEADASVSNLSLLADRNVYLEHDGRLATLRVESLVETRCHDLTESSLPDAVAG